ncbi:MAG: iron ABC transporter permease [Planctomycetota bacterium]|nr:MAG: iron ABC transporter permease [Planctomycetota bacterium]
MRRWAVILICAVGWLALLTGILTPLLGMVSASLNRGSIPTETVAVPSSGILLVRSLTLSAVATLGAIILGLLPAAVLGASGRRRWPVLMGLTLAPLLIPPQVYAYAWGLALAPNGFLGGLLPTGASSMWAGGAVRAGVISAGWLWPIVTLIVSAGWRTTGQAVYSLAILDTTPTRAFVRAVVPSLRPYLIAAACLVFAVTLLEYAIPHLTLSRVYATELMVLVDVGAPTGQIMDMAVQPIAIVMVLIALAAWSIQGVADWQPFEVDDRPGRISFGYGTWTGSILIWLISVGIPVLVMATSLRDLGAWREGFVLFARQWSVSLFVSSITALVTVALAVGTITLRRATDRRWVRTGTQLGAFLVLLSAMMPPAALGIGLVVAYNRPGIAGNLYTHTPWIWILSLAARYGAIAVLIVWLAVGRRVIVTVDQARTDGAGSLDVLTYVLLPIIWPSLLAAGLIVVVLSLFEVVVTQLVGPIGFEGIALTILGHMHYGRDDVVITTSLVIVAAGIVAAQICSWLLLRARK